MSDIVFVTPNFNGSFHNESIGTLLLATILRENKIEPKILRFYDFGDINEFDKFMKEFEKRILAESPKILSFYTRCDTYHIVLKMAQRVKEVKNDICIVFGGPQADLSVDETLKCIPYVDYICCGEGETTIVPFFSSILAGKPDLSVAGLAYLRDGIVVKNPRPALIEDLDSLPFVDYSFLEYNNENDKDEMFSVDAGRGCPFGCTYCSTKTFWKRKYRIKSAERIVSEVKDIHEKFGTTQFVFCHDMLTLDRKKICRICELLKNIGFDIKWGCSARTDCIDKELIDTMISAGMNRLFVGIETGSPRMQKIINKNLKLDGVYELLEHAAKQGVTVIASFIYGFPEETEEDFSQTIKVMTDIVKIPNVVVQNHLCAFFPGTELTANYKESLLRAPIASNIVGEHATKECEEIINANPELFPHFREYKTELREKQKFYPLFFRLYRVLYPIYDYISHKYEPLRMCDMYYDFVESSGDILDFSPDDRVVLKSTGFIDRFADDEKYNVMRELHRYFLWNMNRKAGDVDIYGFDVSAYVNEKKPIAEIEEKITIVSFLKNKDGNMELTFKQM